MKSISFYLLVFIVILSSCTKSSVIKGTVYCPINDEPLSSVLVTALTSTNIEQDKKYERITSKTNVNGDFVLKGLSDKYVYDVFVSSDNFESNRIKVNPPEKGQTLLLDEPILAIASPVRPGIYIYQDGNYQDLLFNNTANLFDFSTLFATSRNYIPYKPTNLQIFKKQELFFRIIKAQ
jgi:hypothetical protein